LNRRAFLRGAAGVSIALPFLEGLPERSAWAQDAKPVFSLFVVTANGIVPEAFWPAEHGPLTSEGLAAAGKATSRLSPHAKNLLLVSGIRWPMNAGGGCSHAQGLVMSLTARASTGGGSTATSTGPSADVVIAEKVQPGVEPLALYAGNRKNGYIAERLSFAEAGVARTADDNPYTLYAKLVGLAAPDGSMTPDGMKTAELLLESRKSVHDLVRGELTELLRHPRLSSMDRQRLQQHFEGIRDAETGIGGMAGVAIEQCNSVGLDITALEALKGGFVYTRTGGVTDAAAKLHMSLVAMAFACNYNRTATLQWGDGTDGTIYDVPSNTLLGGWSLEFIGHRNQSSSAVGNNPTAEQAHIEIDALRLQNFSEGLDHFAARGLADQCFVLWTNHMGDAPSHSFRNVPTIIWGSGGGYLKQAEYLAAESQNNRLLNTLISAAIQDTGTSMEDFGEGTTAGQLDEIRA
jgi:hypothetical protein